MLSDEQKQRGQEFAKSQHRVPYEWTGISPEGYDSSGFQSAVLDEALGRTEDDA